MSYLLDTNIFVEPMRPKPSRAVVRKMIAYEDELAISAITLHEVEWGIARMPKGKRRRSFEEYFAAVLAAIEIIPYDADAARLHASERARLDAEGTPMPYEDGQIAGTALARGLILVTNNVRHFQPFRGLSVENWMR